MSTQRSYSGPSMDRGKQQMPAEAQDSEDRNLYVTRMWPGAHINALRNYFSNFGDVVDVRRRSADIVVVTFASPYSVARTLSFLSHTIDGHPVEVRKILPNDRQIAGGPSDVNGSGATNRSKKIFVGGLDSSVKEEDLRNYFKFYGNITDVNIVYDRATRRSKGYGFVTFDSEDVVDNILEINFHQLNGKKVFVRRGFWRHHRDKSVPPRPQQLPPAYGELSGYGNSFPRPPTSVDLCFAGYHFNGVYWEPPPPWTLPSNTSYLNQGHGGANWSPCDITSYTTPAAYQGPSQPYLDQFSYSNLDLSHTYQGGHGVADPHGYWSSYGVYGGADPHGYWSSYGVSSHAPHNIHQGGYGAADRPYSDQRNASSQPGDNLELAAEFGLPDDLY